MARFIATVEYEAGEYWISFPGINKAGSHAKRPEDIVSHARNFLTDRAKYGSPPPASLDDAITDPSEPFDGVRLVVFDWEPPPRTGYRITGYEDDELVLAIPVPAEKIDAARARILKTGALTMQEAHEIVGMPLLPCFVYFLEAEADAETAT